MSQLKGSKIVNNIARKRLQIKFLTAKNMQKYENIQLYSMSHNYYNTVELHTVLCIVHCLFVYVPTDVYTYVAPVCSLGFTGVKLHVGSGSANSLDWEEEEEGGGEERKRRKEELVRAELQRRIESRKPPSLNKIPATEPVFHQVQHMYCTYTCTVHCMYCT